MERLRKLINAYNDAPEIYHATRYWKDAANKIIEEIKKADLSKMRSGQYPVFSKFGFYEYVYPNAYGTFFAKNSFQAIKSFAKKIIASLLFKIVRYKRNGF